MQRKAVYPFCGIVGQEDMKLALILNVINPSLGGVLIKGEKGTAKSTAVRALADLLPEMHSVAGCKFNCNPKTIEYLISSQNYDKYKLFDLGVGKISIYKVYKGLSFKNKCRFIFNNLRNFKKVA